MRTQLRVSKCSATLRDRLNFVEHAQEVNARMPGFVAQRVSQALNERGMPVRGSRVLTAHSAIDFAQVVRTSLLVFDARGVTRGSRRNVVRL